MSQRQNFGKHPYIMGGQRNWTTGSLIKAMSRNIESQILPNLQSNILACHSFMGAGRRHETPTSEIKDFVTDNSRSRQNYQQVLALVSPVPIPTGWCYTTSLLSPLRKGLKNGKSLTEL